MARPHFEHRRMAPLLILAMSVDACARIPASAPPGPPTSPVASSEPVAAAPASPTACSLDARVRLDADSVALRFTAAFLKLGILPIRLSLPSVDGVAAGPVEVVSPAPARISARASTGLHADSTAYRVQVQVGPPQGGWAADDSTAATAHAVSLCARVVRLAFPAGG